MAQVVTGSAQETGSADANRYYLNEVKPLLQAHCFRCHGDRPQIKAGLNLTYREGVLKGGDTGPAVDLIAPEKSLLSIALSYRNDHLQMPPDGRLSDEEIGVLENWIRIGLPHEFIEQSPVVAGDSGSHEPAYDNTINEKTRKYWAFQPVGNPQPPRVEDPDWGRNAIDAYIRSKLDEAGLSPNGPADKRQLIRRVYYDLIGLPPGLSEVEAFVSDPNPDAYERLIDDLLASPHYGERWGRHWLDVVRYAETNGYERDNPKPNAWRYRDYVIRAFNQDKPYDQFVLEQIAGDELAQPTTDSIVATGFQRLGIWDDEPADPEQAFYDGMDDVVSTTSQVFLGLTLGCARCHDHKIDPVPQRDYYRFLAFFRNTYNNIRQGKFEKTPYHLNTQTVIASEEEQREFERRKNELSSAIAKLESRRSEYETRLEAEFSNAEKEDARDNRTRRILLRQYAEKVLSPDDYSGYLDLMKEIESLQRTEIPPLASALAIKENGVTCPDTHVLIRGSAHSPGEMVQPGYPEVLGFPDPTGFQAPSGGDSCGRRIVLARWIASPDNPLTARVMVNRIWQHHFGRGIVPSSNNFGQNGEPPTHPELLRWLAARFVQLGWSVKKLHKEILLSRAYQMSSEGNPVALEKDPTNSLFWRYDMRRLAAEEIRDSFLVFTGRLNPELGGPSVYPPIPEAVLATASRPDAAWGVSPESQHYRRSVYIHVKRSLPEPMLKSFDLPDTDSSCAVRFATTVPTQALTMLNSEWISEQSEALASRVVKLAGEDADLESKIERVLTTVTCRPARPDEVRLGCQLVERLQSEIGVAPDVAFERFCLLALNLNEFVFVD